MNLVVQSYSDRMQQPEHFVGCVVTLHGSAEFFLTLSNILVALGFASAIAFVKPAKSPDR